MNVLELVEVGEAVHAGMELLRARCSVAYGWEVRESLLRRRLLENVCAVVDGRQYVRKATAMVAIDGVMG